MRMEERISFVDTTSDLHIPNEDTRVFEALKGGNIFDIPPTGQSNQEWPSSTEPQTILPAISQSGDCYLVVSDFARQFALVDMLTVVR